MVICKSYMHEFSVSKLWKKEKGGGNREKVVAHLCLTLIIKKLKISDEQDRVVSTLNTIKH